LQEIFILFQAKTVSQSSIKHYNIALINMHIWL